MKFKNYILLKITIIFIADKCINNDKYLCITQYYTINKCINNLVVNQKIDDCKYHELKITYNYEKKIANTNELIIISPEKQKIQFI